MLSADKFVETANLSKQQFEKSINIQQVSGRNLKFYFLPAVYMKAITVYSGDQYYIPLLHFWPLTFLLVVSLSLVHTSDIKT